VKHEYRNRVVSNKYKIQIFKIQNKSSKSFAAAVLVTFLPVPYFLLTVETGHWYGGGTSNHADVPVESSEILLWNQILWLGIHNSFVMNNEYGRYGMENYC
jgi:hypothetical protein